MDYQLSSFTARLCAQFRKDFAQINKYKTCHHKDNRQERKLLQLREGNFTKYIKYKKHGNPLLGNHVKIS